MHTRTHFLQRVSTCFNSPLQKGIPASDMCRYLQERGINMSVSTITSNRTLYESMGGLQAVVRASVHYYNTSAEVAMLVKAVAECPTA